ncbi:synaptonemal complex protein 1 isoform X2 [Amphiprion ocellaris]|uniref:synaptonemal complex protein 1 isoform X2 n=1 Tax=Amphiprion ocellaris TaxID=80972 RepID=UPI0024117329|nr:synaptonemal complex protein 1 isoform X2 [Amphiprion ocellaris]
MERDRGFNFKLLVPRRVNTGEVSAVRPQGRVENFGDFINTVEESHNKCHDKEPTMPFPNTSLTAPTKPTRQDFPKMKVVLPIEKDKNNCNPGQLYSKLFDEVEKIKCWKVKVDSDSVQKERRLQDNRRTMETQRKAIQELQFGNESLSIKLEEQISENEDLRNKNNATRNLCNILKDTFQWSAEKMHLFESEREETHQLFVQNSENVKKLTAGFESLRIQVEADQQELQKVKEGLLQFESLQEKYQQEYKIKDEEVVMLKAKLHETQKQLIQLQEAANQQLELLRSSKNEQNSLLQKLHTAEQRCKETEKILETVAKALEQNKKEYAQIIQSKDLSMQELSTVNSQQAVKLEQVQMTIQELENSLELEIQRAKDVQGEFMANNAELERKNILIGETTEQIARKDDLIKILEDELDKKSKSIESMKSKIDVTEARVQTLVADVSQKTEEIQLIKNEAEIALSDNTVLKKACKAAEKEQQDLKEKTTLTEIKVQELQGQLFTEMQKSKECTFQIAQLKTDIMQHEVKYEELLSNFHELQSEKTAFQQQFENGFSNVKAIEANMKVSEEKAVKLKREIERLEEENRRLREEASSIKNTIQEALQKKIEENHQHLLKKIVEKEKQIKTVEAKLGNVRKQFQVRFKALEEYKKENKRLQEEFQNLKKLKEEDHQKLLKDLESKSNLTAELENEIQKLSSTATEAIKNKEDTELKCQHKIADMVALMEKHKSQYDRMVDEKDAELDEIKKKEMDAVAQVLDLSKHKTENDELKKLLKTETTEKENLQKKLIDLKKEKSSVKTSQPSQAKSKQSTDPNYKPWRCFETPVKSSSKTHIFDFSKTRKTPSCRNDDEGTSVIKETESATESIRTPSETTLRTKHIYTKDLKTPGRATNRVSGTSKMKLYRIRTPPSAEKAAQWGKRTIELDPRSDSSDQNDLLTFVNAPELNVSAPHCKLNIFKKLQSPVTHKSPGNSLKLAAMKRMRDAGWTAVTGCDKKKKKTTEKIFA